MIGRHHDHAPAGQVRREEGALQTDAAVAVAEQHDRIRAIGHGRVASGGVFVHGGNVGGEQCAYGLGNEIANVVRLGSGGAFDGRIPNFDLIAGFECEGGDAHRERAGFDIRL